MADESLHDILVGIQGSPSDRIRSNVERLSRSMHDDNYHTLHAYLKVSPCATELFSVITRGPSVPVATVSATFYCISSLLMHSCDTCREQIRTVAEFCCSAQVYGQIASHLASDDKNVRRNAVQLCSLVVKRCGHNILRRINWSQRVWRHSTPATTHVIINALQECPRVALTIDGAAALARLTLQNVETLSAPQMSVFVDAVANHTKLFAPVLSGTVLSRCTNLLAGGDRKAELALKLFQDILLTNQTPTALAVRAATSLDVFTSNQQRSIVLDWVKSDLCSPVVLSAYLAALRFSLEPRLSFRYVCNATFVDQLLRSLPLPSNADKDALPAPVTKAVLSSALQRQSPLVVHLAQRIVVTLARRCSKQALAMLPDSQVVIRSASSPDDPLWLSCIRAYIEASLLPRDAPWSLFASRIVGGDRIADFMRLEMLCNAPRPGNVPGEELLRSLVTTCDPRVFVRVSALVRALGLATPTDDEGARMSKRVRPSDDDVVNLRTEAFRSVDRHELLVRLLGKNPVSADDEYVALLLTVNDELARAWKEHNPSSSNVHSQMVRALVARRFPSLRFPVPELSDEACCSAIIIQAPSIPVLHRLKLAQQHLAHFPLVRALVPTRWQACDAPSVDNFIASRDLDRDVLSTLTRTCFDNEPLEEFLRQLYLAEGGPQRFGKAKKDLFSIGIAVPQWMDDELNRVIGVLEDEMDAGDSIEWVHNPDALRKACLAWETRSEITAELVNEVLRAYGATLSELDLLRYDCLAAADRHLAFDLHGRRFGSAAEGYSVLDGDKTGRNNNEWFWDCVRPIVKKNRGDPRWIVPAALAALDRSDLNGPLPAKISDCGIISFVIRGGLCSACIDVRSCSYAFLHRVQSCGSTSLSSEARLLLELVRNSVVTTDEDDDGDVNDGEADLPVIPSLTASLWASLFECVVSRKGTAHPMYKTASTILARRAWLPVRKIPDEFQMNDPFQPVRQMQWIVQCWADGLSDYTSARTMAKSGLWPRILTLHAQLANSNAVGRDIQPLWALLEAAVDVQRSRSDLVEKHSLLSFIHANIEEDGAMSCLARVTVHFLSMSCSAGVRAQCALLFHRLRSLRHRLSLPVAARLACVVGDLHVDLALTSATLTDWLTDAEGTMEHNEGDLPAIMRLCGHLQADPSSHIVLGRMLQLCPASDGGSLAIIAQAISHCCRGQADVALFAALSDLHDTATDNPELSRAPAPIRTVH
ncbi:unnamed protein product (mitochondrion) [Plasmodiophora brassicae]|uniref:URB1 C-terminal domain-containing protein n=1 Tax=Plasmodiophora brassicae TaxID=37360 RepID=A0A3P3Y5A3_PLABS|nr:unnamed protein product [Plasmodiophora brassicae]